MGPMWVDAGRALTVAALIGAVGCGSQDAGGDSFGQGGFGGEGGSRGDPAQLGGEIDSRSVECAGDLTIFADPGHRMASALYAKAALGVGAWPRQPELIRRDDFYAYFAPASSAEGAAFGRFFPGPETDRASMEVWLTRPPAEAIQPVRLVIVVDESSSMRSELALTGGAIELLAQSLGAVPGDGLAIVEWGDEVTVELAEGAGALSLAQTFRERLDAKEQLAGAPSFATLEPVVSELLTSEPSKAAGARAHVVLITDGGLAVDAVALSAFRAWGTNGIASVLEVHQVAGAPPPSPSTQLSSAMHTVGGGLALYLAVDDEPAQDALAQEILVTRFDALFRPSDADSRMQIRGSGIRLTEEVVAGGQAKAPWLGHAGSVLARADVTFCAGAPPAALILDANLGLDQPVSPSFQLFRYDESPPAQPDAGFLRFRRMQLVDALVDVLQSSCVSHGDRATTLIASLDAEIVVAESLQTLLGADGAPHLAALSTLREWAILASAVTECG